MPWLEIVGEFVYEFKIEFPAGLISPRVFCQQSNSITQGAALKAAFLVLRSEIRIGRKKTNRRACAEEPVPSRVAHKWSAVAFWKTGAIATAAETVSKAKADPDKAALLPTRRCAHAGRV